MFHVHRAERADGLVEALGGVLREPLADPMRAEQLAVPTRGVERWLAQRLSGVLGTSPGRGDGVCANVEFPFPGRLVGGAVARAAGVDPASDPWRPERAVWPLLAAVEAAVAEPWLAPLAGHLGDPGDPARAGRRFGIVRHVADLYDGYAVHRPELILEWSAGGGEAWQPKLWRRLRERIGAPSPAERTAAACARLRDEPAVADLPERVSLFGLTRLPPSYLDVLRALAAGRDVHLFLLHPSAALWDRVAEALAGGPVPRRRGEADAAVPVPASPLLRAWGRDAREMQLVLAAGGGEDAVHPHVRVEDAPATLLGRLQAAVREDRPPPGAPGAGEADARPRLDPGDRSVQVHACHGRARQVEVVRDVILHLLADDPTLEPRDVIVMCPDIEAYAPLIHATFGAVVGADEEAGLPADERPVDLSVRLADRSLRQTNPVLAVVGELLDLAAGRLTASQVLGLAGREPVRRRFDLDDDALARVAAWARAAGVRWGLDADGRAPYQLQGVDGNTWRAGWDRVLVGAAMSEEGARLVGGVLPLDDVAPGDIDLAGRFAELLDRLRAAVARLREPMPLADWADAIAAAADAVTASPGEAAWERVQLARLLDGVVAEAAAAGGDPALPLALAEMRSLLADRLRGRPTRASFRTGHLTMCTLVPMRSVPHRVVCLMGLDDGVFPRATTRDGDDLIAADPHVGDRDARSEERQLLLDALLAARDHLVVTYAGRDERTNERRPPSVPVGELLDAIDATVRPPAGAADARARILVEHPLQPFDRRNFVPGALVPDGPFGFDPLSLAGAAAMAGDRDPAPPFLDAPLPPLEEPVVELDQLVSFLASPVKGFLRQRLGIGVGDYDDDPEDAMPVELDGLGRWQVGQKVLEGRLAGIPTDACVAAERARGSVPPGRLADRVLDQVAADVDDLLAALHHETPDPPSPRSIEVRAPLADGRTVVGTVPGIRGHMLTTVTYSRLGPRARLTAWIHLLTLACAHPDVPWRAVTIGRVPDDRNEEATVAVARLELADAARAPTLLARLADLRDRGLREPLPIACKTSAAYAAAVRNGGDGIHAAGRQWRSAWAYTREDAEAAHVLVHSRKVTVEELFETRALADASGDGWAEDETSRAGRLARRLWDDLLAAEEIAER